jgi:tRNA U34 2-thiouridine synthase MnmA/TrmU
MKALSVFSGGLDSMLSANLIRDQGIDVLGIFFETPFFAAHRAKKSAQSIGLPIQVVNITERHLQVVKNPKHGYGNNMNPCIDCHAVMFRMAGEMLLEKGAGFVITGEVLGQRPMSQNNRALDLVAFESGLGRLLLRPLSAKLLAATLPEERGWVDRERLMDIQGRSRKPQMALARKMNIREYPSPAGGCLLTDKVFSRRLKNLLHLDPDPALRDIELLKLGRHFRLDDRARVVVGRNRKENESLRGFAAGGDSLLTTINMPGPTVLLVGKEIENWVERAALLTAAYSDAKNGEYTEVSVQENASERILKVPVQDKSQFRKDMI